MRALSVCICVSQLDGMDVQMRPAEVWTYTQLYPTHMCCGACKPGMAHAQHLSVGRDSDHGTDGAMYAYALLAHQECLACAQVEWLPNSLTPM